MALGMVLLLIAAFAYSYYRFDRTILPLVLNAAELKLQTDMNNVINEVIQEIIRENRITASDFYTQSYDADAGSPVLSVNTVLVNGMCNEAAKRISQRLNNLDPEVVSVPIGMAFNLDTLSQVGPRFNFTMAPIGNALVHYDSQFTSVGINQVHFSVWLEVEALVRIINPVHSFEVQVSRHVSLVDTIISGVVPDTYFHLER
jgi:sporulation protein YunB